MDQTPTTLDPASYLEALRRDGNRIALLASARSASLVAAVPFCPGWSVRDVVIHTGQVYLHKVLNMRTSRPAEFPEDDPGEDVIPWFRQTLAELLTELESRGADAPSYTWWPADQTVGFWYRRMALETAVHRVDVESAFDAVTPLDAALAVDGVDEVLTRFLVDERTAPPDDTTDASAGIGGIVAVRTGDHAWRVALEADGVDVQTGPGSADATITGEPSELLLWLWGRRPDKAVSVTGEDHLGAALRERLRLATQ